MLDQKGMLIVIKGIKQTLQELEEHVQQMKPVALGTVTQGEVEGLLKDAGMTLKEEVKTPLKEETKSEAPYTPPEPKVSVPPTGTAPSTPASAEPEEKKETPPPADPPPETDEKPDYVPELSEKITGMMKEYDKGTPVAQWVQKQKRAELIKAATAINIPQPEVGKVSELRSVIIAVLSGAEPIKAVEDHFSRLSVGDSPAPAPADNPAPSQPSVGPVPLPGVVDQPKAEEPPATPPATPPVEEKKPVATTGGFGMGSTPAPPAKLTREILADYVEKAKETHKEDPAANQVLNALVDVAGKIPMDLRRKVVNNFISGATTAIKQAREAGQTAVAEEQEGQMKSWFGSMGCEGQCLECPDNRNISCIAKLNCNSNDPYDDFITNVLSGT